MGPRGRPRGWRGGAGGRGHPGGRGREPPAGARGLGRRRLPVWEQEFWGCGVSPGPRPCARNSGASPLRMGSPGEGPRSSLCPPAAWPRGFPPQGALRGSSAGSEHPEHASKSPQTFPCLPLTPARSGGALLGLGRGRRVPWAGARGFLSGSSLLLLGPCGPAALGLALLRVPGTPWGLSQGDGGSCTFHHSISASLPRTLETPPCL